ncbi:MAG TPA: DbpA RNA binding domain-containing protein, partial [Micropruina sp.]|nr:DbpA RNA binding domain-containing protein [Micropruina sp.]
LFRQVVAHYVNEYDVPELDVAAALALQAQGEEPLLLDPDADPQFRPPRGSAGREGPPLATYRIAVGKRQRITPRHIVGALANEGGLGRSDFGHIDIRADHSLVELPASLPRETRDALRSTRISGKLIDLTPAAPREREWERDREGPAKYRKPKGPRSKEPRSKGSKPKGRWTPR